MKKTIWLSSLLVIMLSLNTGCSLFSGGDDEIENPPTSLRGNDLGGESIGEAEGSRRHPVLGEPGYNNMLLTIYFDYDSSVIRSDQLPELELNVQYLIDNPSQALMIEGHSDERGTIEYNFALGERRAQAVRSFFISRGVEASRISSISKGEENPAVEGHDESAWSQNRRALFLLVE